MKHQLLLNLSIKYSPPKINLRDAEILDSYGSLNHAKIPIVHNHPNDVKKMELDYYGGWVYSFMNFEDLLFYFYSIVREFEKDPTLDCSDSFLYSLNRCFKVNKNNISTDDYLGIIDGIQWMWDIGGSDYSDFEQCESLLLEIDSK